MLYMLMICYDRTQPIDPAQANPSAEARGA